MKKEHYSNFCTFEIASLLNVLGNYLRKYGSSIDTSMLLGNSLTHTLVRRVRTHNYMLLYLNDLTASVPTYIKWVE